MKSIEIPILETVTSSPRIDKTAGVIYGVKLLGPISRNSRANYSRRRYSENALKEQAGLCEGIGVNVNHPPSEAEADRPRTFTDRIGLIKNARFVNATEGTFGDLHYNPAHPWAKTLEWWADNQPAAVALSQNADGRGRIENGELCIESVAKVRSIDLVADGGTNKSLFEGLISDKIETDEQLKATRKISNIAQELVSSILGCYGDYADSDLTPSEKKARIVAVLDEWEALLTKDAGSTGANSQVVTEEFEAMDFKGVTLEQLRKERPDIVDAVLLEHKSSQEQQVLLEERKTLKARVDVLETEKKIADRRTKISGLLEEAKLPKEAISDLFQSQLLEAADDSAVTRLIEDRKTVWFAPGKPQPTKGHTQVKSSSQTLLEHAGQEKKITTSDELVAALK
jgi:hypothetical protein